MATQAASWEIGEAAASAAAVRQPRRRPSRPRRHGRGGWIFGTLATALLLAGIVWAARAAVPARPPAPSPPLNPWVEIVDPIPMFDLSGTAFGAGPPRYAARRARFGPGRRDALTFGDFAAGGGFLRLAIDQPRVKAAPQPFFSAVARQAAWAGLSVQRSAVPEGVDSRFGVLSVADVVLAQGDRTRACLAFRILDPAVRLSGLACGAEGQAFGRPDLVCALDRLDLLNGAADSPVTLFFAKSELARGRGCAADALAPIKARATWLDPGAALPKLKTGANRREPRARSMKSAKL